MWLSSKKQNRFREFVKAVKDWNHFSEPAYDSGLFDDIHPVYAKYSGKGIIYPVKR